MNYPFGQAVRLATGTITDGTNPVDPATLVLTITLPDLTTVTHPLGDFTHIATGQFRFDYLPPQSGRYGWRIVGTAPNVAAEGVFVVAPAFSQLAAAVPPPSGYVTVAEFKAMPTRLAVDQIIVSAIQAAQDHELADVLQRSSAWADAFCNLPAAATLGAKTATITRRTKVNRNGDVHIPVGTAGRIPVQVTTVAYGGLRTALTTLTDLTAVLVQCGTVTATLGGYTGAWQGALQFGQPTPGCDYWVRLGLVIGWPNTQIAANVAANATMVTVTDPTGILAGQQIQIPDPGVEELVTVLSVAANVVTLTAPLASAHSAGAGFTAIPADVREAVAYAACARLVTPGEETNPLPGASRLTGKQLAGQDSSYAGQAMVLLAPYRRALP